MSDESDEAYSVTEQLTMTGINRIRQKINVHGIPVYLCEACGNPIPEARRKIFPGVTLCVECQAYRAGHWLLGADGADGRHPVTGMHGEPGLQPAGFW